MEKPKIPYNCIRRVSVYVRELERLDAKGRSFISSSQLGDLLGYKPSQIRKDLSFFGQFGEIGHGYNIKRLKNKLLNILGIQKKFYKVAVVGVGNLGSALLNYPGFRKHGFRIVEAFDQDSKKINTTKGGISIKSVSKLPQLVKSKKIDIGIITVPVSAAQKIADLLVASGIKAIFNFAPINLELPKKIILKDIDLNIELESLAYYLKKN